MTFPFEPLDPDTFARCDIAAAVLGAGALTAGAGIYGAQTAASAQEKAAQAAIAAQQQQFGITQQALQPFINTGTNALSGLTSFTDPNNPSSPLNALLALTTPGPNQNAALAATPGYQFSLTQGQQAVNNALAARGLGGSPGAVAKGTASFTEGLAGTQWQSIVNALQNTFTSGSGALQNLVTTGGQAAGALGGASTTTGGQIGSNLIGAGNAAAGAATSTANSIGGLGNSISTAAILQKLLGSSGSTPGLYAGGTGAAAGAVT